MPCWRSTCRAATRPMSVARSPAWMCRRRPSTCLSRRRLLSFLSRRRPLSHRRRLPSSEPPKAAVVPEPPKALSHRSGEARRALVIGGSSDEDVVTQLDRVHADALAGQVPPAPDLEVTLRAAVRLAIDYADAAELATKADKARKAFAAGNPAMWRLLKRPGRLPRTRAGAQGRVPLHRPGLAVREHAAVAARVASRSSPRRSPRPTGSWTPLLGRTLSSYIFIDGDDPKAVAQLEQQLLQTEITQPAVLTSDAALTRMLAAHGVKPDMVMGHSLGEYGALVAAGAMDFSSALEAVSARGHGNGPPEHRRQRRDGRRVRPAAGDRADRRGVRRLRRHRERQQQQPGRHRWSDRGRREDHRDVPGRRYQRAAHSGQPRVPHLDRRSGERAAAREPAPARCARAHAADRRQRNRRVLPGRRERRARWSTSSRRQVASPVQFVKGLHTLYDAGARVFVEVGPKKALHGFVEDVFARARRRARPVHQPPQAARRHGVQPGAVRPLRGRLRSCRERATQGERCRQGFSSGARRRCPGRYPGDRADSGSHHPDGRSGDQRHEDRHEHGQVRRARQGLRGLPRAGSPDL